MGGSSDPTPLFAAAELGNAIAIRILLDNGADVNRTCQAERWSPLYIAARNDHVACVELLRNAGAALDVQDSVGHTPAFIAACEGTLPCLRALRGARLDLAAHDGATPLMIAAANNRRDCLEYLCDQGVSLDTQTPQGATALYFAAQGGHDACVRLLLARGANRSLSLTGGGSLSHTG